MTCVDDGADDGAERTVRTGSNVASIGADGAGGRWSGDEVAAADNAPYLDETDVRLILDIEARKDDNMVGPVLMNHSADRKWKKLIRTLTVAAAHANLSHQWGNDETNVCLLCLLSYVCILVLGRIKDSSSHDSSLFAIFAGEREDSSILPKTRVRVF